MPSNQSTNIHQLHVVDGVIAHPTDENLRIRISRDEYPSKPYHDGGFPIWRMEPSRNYTGYEFKQETDLTSYETDFVLDGRLSELTREHDMDSPFLLRYLRIFWGVTFMESWHSGSYWYFTCDPEHWRKAVGVEDAATQREDYTKHAWTEWQAWVEGDVWIAQEQRRFFQRTTTRTWDLEKAEVPDDPSSSDEIDEYTTEHYVWQATETGSVGGWYGDPDDDMAADMAWQFGWPTSKEGSRA